jgi:hypothetical protein
MACRFLVVIPGLAEGENPESMAGRDGWIPGSAPCAAPGMTSGGSTCS